MQPPAITPFYAADRHEWRAWMQANHQTATSVWLMYYKKATGKPSLTWSEAVDEALCFGWIDSTSRPIDEERFMQYFCKRKPNSVWSKINKDKVERLIASGQMTQAGLDSIAIAKANGSWTILDAVEQLVVPKDLAIAFRTYPGSKKYFTGCSKSIQKNMLQWIHLARLPATRQKRIDEIASLAAQALRPKQFR